MLSRRLNRSKSSSAPLTLNDVYGKLRMLATHNIFSKCATTTSPTVSKTKIHTKDTTCIPVTDMSICTFSTRGIITPGINCNINRVDRRLKYVLDIDKVCAFQSSVCPQTPKDIEKTQSTIATIKTYWIIVLTVFNQWVRFDLYFIFF